jgi:hypothetical protein
MAGGGAVSTFADRARREREELVRAAIREAVESRDEFALGSLYGLIRTARDEQVFREESAPEQVLLDMHLSGPGIKGHATSAQSFATFVRRVSQATKFTARDIAGTAAYAERLLIEGVGPGSVRVVLRVPDTVKSQTETFDASDVESADSSALRLIARVFTNASADEGEGEVALVAQVHVFPQSAQRALKSAVTEVLRAGWEVHGELLRRRQPVEEMNLTNAGAAKLHRAIKFSPGAPEREVRVGSWDGHRTSRGIAYFAPNDGQGGPFSAAVRDDNLLRRIAWIGSQRDEHGEQVTVRAVFDRFAEDAESGVSSRHSRALREFESLTATGPDQRLL